MKAVEELLNKYGESHQNKLNKAIHWICVPAIVFSLLGLLWAIPVPAIFSEFSLYLNWATLFMACVMVYYLRLSVVLALLMFGISILAMIGLNGLSNYETPIWQISLVIFVIAWVAQFIGHKIEGKKPSFIDDLKFLLIGPLWLLSFVLKSLKIPY
ncbi:MAG: YGL010W-like membrane protein [Sphingobacteriales bacterium]|jgi:uncharacterized membrane protein YGL010W